MLDTDLLAIQDPDAIMRMAESVPASTYLQTIRVHEHFVKQYKQNKATYTEADSHIQTDTVTPTDKTYKQKHTDRDSGSIFKAHRFFTLPVLRL